MDHVNTFERYQYKVYAILASFKPFSPLLSYVQGFVSEKMDSWTLLIILNNYYIMRLLID
jgi:hypothetical protein